MTEPGLAAPLTTTCEEEAAGGCEERCKRALVQAAQGSAAIAL